MEATRLRAEASADQEARRTAVQSRVTDFTAGIEAHYLEFLRLCREMEEATRRWTVVDRADWENPITIIRTGADGEIDVELHTGLPGESQEEESVKSCMAIRTTFEKLLNGTRDLKPEDYDRMIALVERAKQRSTATTGEVKPTRVISQERYDLIKPLPKGVEFFQHFPGVYCKRCGKDFALYSYSAHQPSGVDENGKPFYDGCLMCGDDPPPQPNG